MNLLGLYCTIIFIFYIQGLLQGDIYTARLVTTSLDDEPSDQIGDNVNDAELISCPKLPAIDDGIPFMDDPSFDEVKPKTSPTESQKMAMDGNVEILEAVEKYLQDEHPPPSVGANQSKAKPPRPCGAPPALGNLVPPL